LLLLLKLFEGEARFRELYPDCGDKYLSEQF